MNQLILDEITMEIYNWLTPQELQEMSKGLAMNIGLNEHNFVEWLHLKKRLSSEDLELWLCIKDQLTPDELKAWVQDCEFRNALTEEEFRPLSFMSNHRTCRDQKRWMVEWQAGKQLSQEELKVWTAYPKRLTVEDMNEWNHIEYYLTEEEGVLWREDKQWKNRLTEELLNEWVELREWIMDIERSNWFRDQKPPEEWADIEARVAGEKLDQWLANIRRMKYL